MGAAERSERLRALLAHLTPGQREVLVLRVAVGMSAEETAHAVGATTGAVRVTQHRALVRVRQLLQQSKARRPPSTPSTRRRTPELATSPP
jgi:RNA polymerase sigma-70 factor, ECF subfamily